VTRRTSFTIFGNLYLNYSPAISSIASLLAGPDVVYPIEGRIGVAVDAMVTIFRAIGCPRNGKSELEEKSIRQADETVSPF
jgi:hypothetical protein